MKKKQRQVSKKNFDLIPTEEKKVKIIDHILSLTKKRNSHVQERKQLVKDNMEVRKKIYHSSVDIADLDEIINQELISLSGGVKE